jgi:hypothetical protein
MEINMKQAALQSQLAHNRHTITNLLENRIILRAAERVLFKLSDKDDKNTARIFKKLNAIRDEIRVNDRRLANLAELQIVIKRAIRRS